MHRGGSGRRVSRVPVSSQATSIGLVLSSPRTAHEGDTLVVAPSHLIHQWETEIAKFTDDIQVVVGRSAYRRVMTLPPGDGKSHRVVLVDVETVMKEKRYRYNFRRIFNEEGHLVRKSLAQMEVYKQAVSVGHVGFDLLHSAQSTQTTHLRPRPCFASKVLAGPVPTTATSTTARSTCPFAPGAASSSTRYRTS